MNHLDTSEIQAFILGEMRSRCAVRVARHLDECSECQKRIQSQDPVHSLLSPIQEPQLSDQFLEQIMATRPKSQAAIWNRIPMIESSISAIIFLITFGLVGTNIGIRYFLFEGIPMISEAALILSKITAIPFVQYMVLFATLLIPFFLVLILKLSTTSSKQRPSP